MTEEVNESTLTKIKKMLALSASTNAAESEAAMGMVMAFLTRHNLTLQQVEEHNPTPKKYVNERAEQNANAPEHTHVGRIVARFFNVRIVVGRPSGSVNFLGTDSNVEIAIYIYGYLSQMFDLLWQIFELKNPKVVAGNPNARYKYQQGLSDGLLNELTKQRRKAEQEMGLTLVEDTELTEYFYQQYPDQRPLTKEQYEAKYGPPVPYVPPPPCKPEPKPKRVAMTAEERKERARQRYEEDKRWRKEQKAYQAGQERGAQIRLSPGIKAGGSEPGKLN